MIKNISMMKKHKINKKIQFKNMKAEQIMRLLKKKETTSKIKLMIMEMKIKKRISKKLMIRNMVRKKKEEMKAKSNKKTKTKSKSKSRNKRKKQKREEVMNMEEKMIIEVNIILFFF